MTNQLFRDKSLEKINSPEQLNAYIKVANPGIWLSLGAVAAILLGLVVWSCVASIDTVVHVGVEVNGETAICYVLDSDHVDPGMTVKINDLTYTLGEKKAVNKLEDGDPKESYILHTIGQGEDVWSIEYYLTGDGLEDGIYKGDVVTETIKPIRFLLNSRG